MALKYIEDLPIEGKRTFIRVDFNVPMKDGKITDDTRIREALPTIRHALSRNARVILASHMGRPKGQVVEALRLEPVGARLAELLDIEVLVADDCVGDGVKKLALDLRDGQLLLLENVRFHKEETKNDPEFAKSLAALAEVYINDAFGTAHRAEATTEGMVKHFKLKGAGYLMRKEIKFIRDTLAEPKRPFVAVLGGAKVSDKIGVIAALLNKADAILVGGAMAYTFLKAQKINVGNSLVEADKVKEAELILEQAREKKVKLLLPVDHVVAESLESEKGEVVAHEIPTGKMGLDIGPKTLELFGAEVSTARTIFWNGPMGVFEKKPFANGTMQMAKRLSESAATTVVGGGDSVAAIQQSGLADKISHISTGGGASLELVEGKVLPGIAALE